MKVKVTSTCEISEAPSVAVGLLACAQEELRALSNKKFNYWQVSELLMQISSLRENLANIDHSLNDVSNIASGWLEAVISEVQASEEDLHGIEPEEEELVDEEEG